MDDRNDQKYVFRSYIPLLLFLDDFASLRDGIEAEVPNAARIPSPPRSSILLRPVFRRSTRGDASMAPVGGFGNPLPRDADEDEFPGQGTRNRYRLRNRGLRITGSTDPAKSVSSVLA